MEWHIQEKQRDGEWLTISVTDSKEKAEKEVIWLNHKNGHGNYRFTEIGKRS